MTDWEPPKDVKPWMVCAACKTGPWIVLGARHWDEIMRSQLDEDELRTSFDWDQGFIDQWGRFYTREEALVCVKDSGQPFNNERNGGHETQLFSEGLY